MKGKQPLFVLKWNKKYGSKTKRKEKYGSETKNTKRNIKYEAKQKIWKRKIKRKEKYGSEMKLKHEIEAKQIPFFPFVLLWSETNLQLNRLTLP
jgi:hypothetical protein